MKKTYSARSALFSDSPIASVDRDEFGRAEFAKMLAESIAHVPADDGFVYALNAPWGSGKTSTLNFVCEHLQDPEVNNSLQFVVVQFNPWWFSGGDSLVHDFFRQFSGAFAKEGKKIGVRQTDIRSIADGLDACAGMIEPAAGLLPLEPHVATAAVSGGIVAKSLARVVKWMSPDIPKDIHGIRNKIRKSLDAIKNEVRVLVVIDDLDRIQPNETLEIFRLVKGVADFPNTIYLLSFDRDAVIRAITHEIDFTETDASKYLEKIVQVSNDLPPVEKGILHEYFGNQLKKVVPAMETGEWDGGYWHSIFYDAASHFIATPRDVKRWINNIAATYPGIRDEVNPMDFAAIQGLRTFVPGIYRAIGENKSLFVELPAENILEAVTEYSNREQKTDIRQKEAEVLLQDVFLNSSSNLGKHAAKIAEEMFPFWKSNLRREADSVGWAPSWGLQISTEDSRRRNMARHPMIFDRYFYLSLSAGDFSGAEMEQIIAAAKNPKKFAEILLTFAKEDVPGRDSARLRIFLDRMMELGKTAPMSEHVSSIALAFLMVSDKPELVDPQLFSLGYEYAIVMSEIAGNLLMSISDEGERFEICRNAFTEGEAIWAMCEWISMFRRGLNHELGGEFPLILGKEHCDELEKVVIRKLRPLAEKAEVWNWRNPRGMLSVIKREIGEKEHLDCVHKAILTPAGLAAICDFFDGRISSLKERERVTGMKREDLADKARQFLQDGEQLDDHQREILRHLVERVENPDKYSDD